MKTTAQIIEEVWESLDECEKDCDALINEAIVNTLKIQKEEFLKEIDELVKRRVGSLMWDSQIYEENFSINDLNMLKQKLKGGGLDDE